MRRRTFNSALAGVALAGISLSATLAHAQDKKTFALVQINQQALFFNQMNEGAQKAADAAGVKLVIFNANNDPAAQNSAIETYIQQKVDGLAVVAIDVNGIMPAVQQAADAGIPVVAIDAILPDGPQKAQIGVDNAKAGADMGEYFLDYVKANMGGKAKIGIVGALNSFIQNIRQKGFEDVVKAMRRHHDGRRRRWPEHPGQRARRGREPDHRQSRHDRDLRHRRAGVDGRHRRGREPGQAGTVKVFGWDLTAQAIAGIDAGYVVGRHPAGPGRHGRRRGRCAARRCQDGGTVEKNIAVPVTIVTKENVEPYRAVFK